MTTTAPIATSSFANAMSAAVTGVYVVTTDGPAGRFGLTVSSLLSVSAEPPVVLVSVSRRSPLLPALLENGVFGVNALGNHQSGLADTFAGRPALGPAYDFGAARWDIGPSGAPLLVDAAAHFECRVESAIDAGTHVLILGTVHEASRGAVCALAYTRRDYARVVTQARPPSADLRSRQSA